MKRHTIIATNLNAEQMQARYGDRVASRLMDTKDTMIIGFAGGDAPRGAIGKMHLYGSEVWIYLTSGCNI